jgi:Tfp pilus assembly protein PilO
VLVGYLAVRPRWAAVEESRARLDSARGELQAAQDRVLNYAQLVRQAPARRRFLERFDVWIPKSESMPEVLAAAAQAARKAGVVDLTFARLAAEKAVKSAAHGAVAESAIELEARATLPAIGVFIDQLLASPRYLRIDEVKVAPLATERLARLSTSDPARLGLTIRVTTFSQRGGS